jgi:hypothetical protein
MPLHFLFSFLLIDKYLDVERMEWRIEVVVIIILETEEDPMHRRK